MSELEQIVEDTLKEADKRTLLDKIRWNAPSYGAAIAGTGITYMLWEEMINHFVGFTEPRIVAMGAIGSVATLYFYKEWFDEWRLNRKVKKLRAGHKQRSSLLTRITASIKECKKPYALAAHGITLGFFARQPFIRLLQYFPANVYKSVFGCSELITRDRLHLPANFTILPETMDQISRAHRQYHIAEAVYCALSLAGFALLHRLTKRVTPFFLEPDIRRYMLNIGPKAAYYHIRHEHDKLEKLLTDNIDVDPLAALALTEHYIEAGMLDYCFENIAKTKRPKKKVHLGFGDFVKTNQLKVMSLLEKNPDSPLLNAYLGQYALLDIDDDFSFAKRCFAKSAACSRQKNHRPNDYSLLYSLFLQSTQPESEETKDQWEQTIDSIVNENLAQEQIGETSHRVYSQGSRFIKDSLVFKEYESIDQVVDSIHATEQLREIISDHPEDQTYEHITVFEKDGKAISVLRHAEGTTLWQKIQAHEEVYPDIERVVKYLALIHARMPRTQRPVTTQERLAKSLSNPDLALPEHLKQKIADSYAPISNSLDAAVHVYNKDAHPENWLLQKDKVICLDNDPKGLVAQQLDLVNLFDYGKYLTRQQKLSLIQEYVTAYNKYADEKIQCHESFLIGYYNGVIHRALALSSAWSSPDRQSMLPYRQTLVANALDSVVYLRKEHSAYYGEYLFEYERIEEALHEYKRCVSAAP